MRKGSFGFLLGGWLCTRSAFRFRLFRSSWIGVVFGLSCKVFPIGGTAHKSRWIFTGFYVFLSFGFPSIRPGNRIAAQFPLLTLIYTKTHSDVFSLRIRIILSRSENSSKTAVVSLGVSTPASQAPLLGQRWQFFGIRVSTPASQVPLLGQRWQFFGIRFRRCPVGAGHRFAICDAMIRKKQGYFLLRISMTCYHDLKSLKKSRFML